MKATSRPRDAFYLIMIDRRDKYDRITGFNLSIRPEYDTSAHACKLFDRIEGENSDAVHLIDLPKSEEKWLVCLWNASEERPITSRLRSRRRLAIHYHALHERSRDAPPMMPLLFPGGTKGLLEIAEAFSC